MVIMPGMQAGEDDGEAAAGDSVTAGVLDGGNEDEGEPTAVGVDVGPGERVGEAEPGGDAPSDSNKVAVVDAVADAEAPKVKLDVGVPEDELVSVSDGVNE